MNSEFAERLERIRAKQQEGQRPAAPTPRGAEVAQNALYPLSLLGALVLGMVAVLLGNYARYQLTHGGVEFADTDLEMLAGLGLGLGLSFVLAQAFRLTSKEHRGLQAAGVFLMVGLFHNFAHWLPGPMSLAFSPAYVQSVVQETPANSFRFRAAYFPLFDVKAPEEPAAPAEAAAPAVASEPAPGPDCAAEEPALPVVRKGGKVVTKDSAKFVSPETTCPAQD